MTELIYQGGIIALGLGYKLWSAEQACEVFKKLAKESFKTHVGFFPGYEWNLGWLGAAQIASRAFQTLANDSRFDAGAIESQLKKAFDEGDAFSTKLFGNCGWTQCARSGERQRDLKVAVTTNDCSNSLAVLLANYSRPDSDGGKSSTNALWKAEAKRKDRARALSSGHASPGHIRLGSVSTELISKMITLTIPRSARCTSAAPWYFPPYKAFGRTFQDGGLVYNSPVEVAVNETRLLWPDNPQAHVVVTVGTGHSNQAAPETSSTALPKLIPSFATRILSSFNSLLDAESQWQRFRGSIPDAERDRYHRLNVRMVKLPDLADVDAIDDLENLTAETYAEGTAAYADLQFTADALVAALFYPHVDVCTKVADNTYRVSGFISCRLEHMYQSKIVAEMFMRDYKFIVNGEGISIASQALERVRDKSLLKVDFDVMVPEVDGGLSIKLAFPSNGRKAGPRSEHHIDNSPAAFNLD
jgi:hypothetical protein